MSPAAAEALSVSLLAAVLGFAVLRPRGWPEAVAAVPAAALVALTGAISLDHLRSEAERLGPVVGFLAAIHIIGGGSQNRLLCQLTADQTCLPVLAGPVEAAAIGNVLIQARTQALAAGSLDSLRALVARTFTPLRYTPKNT